MRQIIKFGSDYRNWLHRSDNFWKGSSLALTSSDSRLIDPGVVDAHISAELALNALLVARGQPPSLEERLTPALERSIQVDATFAVLRRDCALLDSRFDDANEPTDHPISPADVPALFAAAERVRDCAVSLASRSPES